MAGSYNHCVIHDLSEDDGKFIGIRLLDHLGDALEALEEMYGMIWWLANGDVDLVDVARTNWREGVERYSPGIFPPHETPRSWKDDE